MPSKPKKNEKQGDYMSRCVKELKEEGVSGAKARDICSGVWYSTKKKKN